MYDANEDVTPAIASILSIPVVLLGYVMATRCIWDWYAVKLLGAPAISMRLIFGVSMLYLLWSSKQGSKDAKVTWGDFMFPFFKLALFVGAAWVFKP